jgi:transposase-like protein
MSTKRRQHSPEFKAKVALEALKGIEPVHAIAAKYQVHPVQVRAVVRFGTGSFLGPYGNGQKKESGNVSNSVSGLPCQAV